MCDIKEEEDSLDREGGKARSERNEVDIQKLITTLTTVVSDPFRPEDYKPLRNICTGTVLAETIRSCWKQNLKIYDEELC